MRHLILITWKGLLRDRILQGILVATSIFLFIPSVSVLSMRQVGELAITLSLSLTSFILLLIAIFCGGTALWKDIDRRAIYSVLGLPISRTNYVLGKFFGIAGFLLLISLALGLLASATVWYVSLTDPPARPILWTNILLALAFDCLKYIVVVAVSFLFSTVSTSFFLPIFGTIALFLGGNITQEVYDYLQTPTGAALPALTKQIALFLYYLLPNFAVFDLKANAVYSIPIPANGVLLPLAYGFAYSGLLLSAAAMLFTKRELH